MPEFGTRSCPNGGPHVRPVVDAVVRAEVDVVTGAATATVKSLLLVGWVNTHAGAAAQRTDAVI